MAEPSKPRLNCTTFDSTMTVHNMVEAARERQQEIERSLSLSTQQVSDVTSRFNVVKAELDRLNDLKLSLGAPFLSVQAELEKAKTFLSDPAILNLRNELRQLDVLRTCGIGPSMTDFAKTALITFGVPSHVRDNSLLAEIGRPPVTDISSSAAEIAKSLRPLVPPAPRTAQPPAPPAAPTKAEILAEFRAVAREALGRENLKAIMKEVVDELVHDNLPAPPSSEIPDDGPPPPGQYL